MEEGAPRPDAHYAYHVSCHRIVDEAACASRFQRAYEAVGEDYREWRYETFDAMVDRNGIACFEWISPYTLGEALVTESALLPFSEIQPIAEQMLRVAWLPQTDGINAMTLHVTEVRLEMMRIREANSWSTGLLIPAWNFYGVRERTFNEDFDSETDRTIIMPLLSINAIDGSIID